MRFNLVLNISPSEPNLYTALDSSDPFVKTSKKELVILSPTVERVTYPLYSSGRVRTETVPPDGNRSN